MSETYLSWVIANTKTCWWHDSGEAEELRRGLDRGAVGVTTNPFLSNIAVAKCRQLWSDDIDAVLAQKLPAETAGWFEQVFPHGPVYRRLELKPRG